jgi:hypothetical protein
LSSTISIVLFKSKFIMINAWISHHFVALVLIGFSWIMNCHRIGSLLLFMIDFVDIFLATLSLLRYAKLQTLFKIVLWLFVTLRTLMVFFVIPRCIYGIIYELDVPLYPVVQFFLYMLTLLFVVNIYWIYYEHRNALRFLKTGNGGLLFGMYEDKTQKSIL